MLQDQHHTCPHCKGYRRHVDIFEAYYYPESLIYLGYQKVTQSTSSESVFYFITEQKPICDRVSLIYGVQRRGTELFNANSKPPFFNIDITNIGQFLQAQKCATHGCYIISECYPSLTAHQHQKGHTVPKQV